jgi:hypothetical protein
MLFRAAIRATGVLAWLAVVSAGLLALADYASRPGEPASAKGQWPTGASVPLAASRATFVMFAHPRCPCTRASLGELERIMERCQGRLETHVLFWQPAGAPANWAHTDLWSRAAGIPGVRVAADVGGRETARFGARTSGQTFLYDGLGCLLFSGGITALRGHEGDNAGADAVVDLVTTGCGALRAAPVFGCSLFTPVRQSPGEGR